MFFLNPQRNYFFYTVRSTNTMQVQKDLSFNLKFRISSSHKLSLSDYWKVRSFLRQEKKIKGFPVCLEVQMVLSDHSGKLTFNCGLKLPVYPPERKDMGRPGNVVCTLLLSNDHDSPHIFIPRKRFPGNRTVSSDSLFLPPPTHRVCAHSHANMTYMILSHYTPSLSKYLAHTP